VSDTPRTAKEAAYDEHIAPLMAQIIALCKEHKINMAAQFSLGIAPNIDCEGESPLYCTTCLPIDKADEAGHERMMALRRIMYQPSPALFAFTIASGPKP